MWFFGRERGIELLEKVTVERRLSTRLPELYAILTILDQKAAGLLTINAFLIAGLVAALTAPEKLAKLGVSAAQLDDVLKLQLLALGISAFLCLPVIRISWGFSYYVARNLQNAGIIRYRRGEVRILDRAKLEAMTCECYDEMNSVYDQLVRAAL